MSAITIKQNKQKTEGGSSIQWKVAPALSYNGAKTSIQRKVDPALSYNSAKTVTRKHSFKSSAINGRAKGGKKKRNCGQADGERRKKMIDEHLKLLTMPGTILLCKKYKK